MGKHAISYNFSSMKTLKAKTQLQELKYELLYGPNIVRANHAQFRFRSGNFDVKDDSRCRKQIVANGDKIMEIVASE